METNTPTPLEPGKGDHLCVLVHGLRGNPNHFQYVFDTLRARYDSSVLQILACRRNTGRNTYDGIETGGERVAREIEGVVEEYARDGIVIKKISIVGYSLGGLISRYAIGLLYSKGFFNMVNPVNFTTFATPHLGVRTPRRRWHSRLWNVIGARTLSASGRQLFIIDNFRATGKPLLSVMAERDSVFFQGLASFPNRVLYANITNDRNTSWYTAAISRCDPYVDLSAVSLHFLPRYAPVVLDPHHPVEPAPGGSVGLGNQIWRKLLRLPIATVYALLVSVSVAFYLLNSVLQTLLSVRRIRLHSLQEEWKGYKALPLLLVDGIQETADQVIEDIEHEFGAQHLDFGDEDSSDGSMSTEERGEEERKEGRDEEREEEGYWQVLALHPLQFRMIRNLEMLRFRKFPVWIQGDVHTHAAIIVREPEARKWVDGKKVVAHWVEEVFVV